MEANPWAFSQECRDHTSQPAQNGQTSIFFLFLAFLINIWQINPQNLFFPNVALLNRVSLSNTIYEEVTSVYMTQLMGLACAQATTWCHIGVSRVSRSDASALRELCLVTWYDSSHASSFGVTGPPTVPSLLPLSSSSLSFFFLLSSPCSGFIGDLGFLSPIRSL
jgi:hypothetical protein